MMRATGPSALGNHSISIGAAGGMVSGVLLGIFNSCFIYRIPIPARKFRENLSPF
jgi:hypothetical protein